jgi:hypothetical protein
MGDAYRLPALALLGSYKSINKAVAYVKSLAEELSSRFD